MTLAVTPGKAGSVAVIVTVPGPSVAVKIGLMSKIPEALVVVSRSYSAKSGITY